MKKGVLILTCLFTMITVNIFAEGQQEPKEPEEIIIDEKGRVTNPWAIKAEENELILWSLFTGGDGDYMDEMIANYNNQNPKYKIKAVRLRWSQYYTKLMTAVAAQKGPDIGVSHISKLPELVENGAVVPLDSYADQAGLDWSSINPNGVSSITYGSDRYAVPIDTHAEVLFYNKAILKEAGMLNPDGTLSMGNSPEEFRTFMTELKNKLPEGISALSFPQQGNDPWRVWWAYYFQMGGSDFISEDGKTVTMDREKAIAAAVYLKSLYDDGIIPLNLEGPTQYFQAGNAATFISGVWCTGIFEKADKIDFGVMEIPTLFGRKANWGDSHTFILPLKKTRDEEKSAAALDFMKSISEQGAVWAQAGHIPANINVFDDSSFTELPYRSDYVEVADTVVYFGNSPQNWSIKTFMIENLDAYWNGLKTAEEAIDSMISDIASLL